MVALAETPAGLDTATLASRFRQGRRAEDKIRAVLTALHRMGFVTSDDNQIWRLRRAA